MEKKMSFVLILLRRLKNQEILSKVILVLILLAGFAVRLYKIETPLADHHSWRQVDTASVAKVFMEEGFDVFHPRYHDLSNIASGKENPLGYRFVEFPIYNALIGFLCKVFPAFSLHVWGRLASIFFSLGTGFLLYLLGKKYWGEKIGLLTMGVYFFLPFNIFYSRVVLPEPAAVFLAVLAVFLSERDSFFLSSLIASLALLIKPTSFFILIGCLPFLKKFKAKQIAIWLLVSGLPFFAWRLWIRQFPEGIPAFEWLLTKVNTSQGLVRIAFKPAFFRWIFVERLGKLILGSWGIAFLVLGLLKKKILAGPFYFLFLGAIFYLFVFAGGNVQHDYYQIILLPSLAPILALGIAELFRKKAKKISFPRSASIALFCLIFAFFASWYEVRDFYGYDENLVKAGKKASQLLPSKTKVIADYNGDTTFLYLVERKGFPSLFLPLEEIRKSGAKFYLTLKPNDKFVEELAKKYVLFYKDEHLAIIKLENP